MLHDSTHSTADTNPAANHRRPVGDRPVMAGVSVREDDIEPTKGLRSVALLFRGMAILLLVLMVLQVVIGATSTVAVSPGALFADAVRLTIFAGLLWGGGDLAVLGIKSHYDLRATRILTARLAYMLREMKESSDRAPSNNDGARTDRET